MLDKDKCFYDVLGVERNADTKAIEKAYKELAKKCHPDKFIDQSRKKEADEDMHLLSDIKSTLLDDTKRAYYDEHGRTKDHQTIEQEVLARFRNSIDRHLLGQTDLFRILDNIRSECEEEAEMLKAKEKQCEASIARAEKFLKMYSKKSHKQMIIIGNDVKKRMLALQSILERELLISESLRDLLSKIENPEGDEPQDFLFNQTGSFDSFLGDLMINRNRG